METAVPEHLQELVQPTPSGTAKLIAAWDGLTPESQILILADKERQSGPAYLYHRVLEKALKSENAYVRYLAAREYDFDYDDHEKAVQQQIENDPDPLVRYAILESTWGTSDPELYDSDKFFALPHEARLAKVRRLTSDGKTIAELISHAVDNQLKDGKVSEIELFEILTDYLNKPEFKSAYVKDRLSYDGGDAYLRGRDIESLWELVLKVPEGIAHEIIEHLPERAGLSSGIPKKVLKEMSDHQLMTLLFREDIGLENVRKTVFFDSGKTDEDGKDVAKEMLRGAAIYRNFDLTNEEFADILAKPKKQRVRDLEDLGQSAEDLRLCLYEAIYDARFKSPSMRNFERKLTQLKGWQRQEQLKELKLYRLAAQVVPWKKNVKGDPPSDELAFLKDVIVEGDTWATFMAFSDEWDKQYQRKRLEKHLPAIWEAGEEDDIVYDEDDVDNSRGLADRVAGLVEAVGKLTAHTTVAQERAQKAIDSIKQELVELRQAPTKHRLYMFIVIGLLVLLLFAKINT